MIIQTLASLIIHNLFVLRIKIMLNLPTKYLQVVLYQDTSANNKYFSKKNKYLRFGNYDLT